MGPELRALVEVMAPGGVHRYLSTYCLHARLTDDPGKSERLDAACAATEIVRSGSCVPRDPAQCKCCEAPCVCPCHEAVST